MNDELYEYFQTKKGLEIKRLAIEAGFIAWDEEEWKPAGIVFDWAGADDESLVKFCHLVVRKCADIAYEVGLHRQTKHEILRRFGLKVTDEDKVEPLDSNISVMRQASDAISNVLAGGEFDNPVCDLKQAALALHKAIASSERVNKTAKNEHEDWYGQWQWQCGYERGWDKAMEHVEAKLKEKNNG
jgi:hypothetical protein